MITQNMEIAGGSAALNINLSELKGEHMQNKPNRLLKLTGQAGLFMLFLLGLGLSVAFPFGMGVVAFFWIIALAGSISAVSLVCYRLLKDLLGATATFGYTPTTAYMAGKKTKKTKEEESPDEEKNNNQ